jgi:hypothetical protein
MQHDFILLDRSGSMESMWVEALSSINAYVAQLAVDKVDTGVTLATFDYNIGGISFDVIRDRITPPTWAAVTSKDCSPRGGTPLNDAIVRLVSLARVGGYDKVAIIIMTDGHENQSREDRTGVIAKGMLAECRAKGWQVIFLGADFDNTKQAEFYGNAATQSFVASGGQVVNSMRSTANKRATYGVTGQSMSYSAEEKAEMAKKTPTEAP